MQAVKWQVDSICGHQAPWKVNTKSCQCNRRKQRKEGKEKKGKKGGEGKLKRGMGGRERHTGSKKHWPTGNLNSFCCQQEWTVIKNRKYFYSKTTIKCLSKYKCTKKTNAFIFMKCMCWSSICRPKKYCQTQYTALTFLMGVLNYLRNEANPARSLCADGMFMHEFPGQCCNGLFLGVDGWWEQTSTLS